jgi:hypothetical protein
MSLAEKYRLRMERKKMIFRGRLRVRDLYLINNNLQSIAKSDVLLFTQLTGQQKSIENFLRYYRKIGVSHFLCIVPKDDADAVSFLSSQDDVTLWQPKCETQSDDELTDWLNGLRGRHGVNHWCLSVHQEDRFVYPHMDTRPINALTDWLRACMKSSFGAVAIDLYGQGSGPDRFFDGGNYYYERDSRYQNLLVHGGAQLRCKFSDNVERAPNLGRIPLVYWTKKRVYLRDTEVMLPRRLNNVYSTNGGQDTCGALLRKIDEKGAKAEYWTNKSSPYTDWRTLEEYDLIAKGQWA